MTATVHAVDTPGDAELISAVRGGDIDAYGQLFERHVGAARRLARQLVSSGDVDDLVSEAFVKVLAVLQRGGGPDVAFRAYLLTAVRRLRVDRLRAGARLQPTDEIESFDPGVPFRDTAVEGFESGAAARAFASLPERWQLVLWHTEVEGSKPAEVATLLGMTPNSVSALAYRAREGLRQAFVAEHAAEAEDDHCRWTHQHLGGYIRHGISRRDATRVEEHLGECRRCMAIYLELTEVNDDLAAIIAPLLLGGVSAAYVSAGAVVAPTGLVALLGQLKEVVVANSTTAAVGGVAAVGIVAGGAFLSLQPPEPAAERSSAATRSETSPERRTTSREPSATAREPRARRSPSGATPDSAGGPTGTPTSSPTDAATAATPSPAPTTSPRTSPSPSTSPSASPSAGPTEGTRPSPPEPTGTSSGPEPPRDDEQPPPPPPPPPADLAVTARFSSAVGLPTGRLTIEVVDVSEPAVLRITSDASIRSMVTRDARCSAESTGAVTCRLADDATISFGVTAPTGGVIRATVFSPARDADRGNNTASVAVPGLASGGS